MDDRPPRLGIRRSARSQLSELDELDSEPHPTYGSFGMSAPGVAAKYARKCAGRVALLWLLGCSPGGAEADDTGASSGADPTPYLGSWQLMGNVATTCSDGTSANQPLVGAVSITRGTASDLLRTVAGGLCPAFPLKLTTSSAELLSSVTCPPEPASQVTLTSWRLTLGVDDTSATEMGSAKTVFLPPATGTCSSLYSTSLLK